MKRDDGLIFFEHISKPPGKSAREHDTIFSKSEIYWLTRILASNQHSRKDNIDEKGQHKQ